MTGPHVKFIVGWAQKNIIGFFNRHYIATVCLANFYVLFSVAAPLRGDDAASIRPLGRARQ